MDLRALVSCYLEDGDELGRVYYFSALLESNPEKKDRHLKYINALETKGVTIVLGKFKMLEDVFLNRCDKMILVTADTDFVSTVKKIRKLFSKKKIILLAPPSRFKQCHELRKAVHASLEIKKAHIKKSLLD